MANYADLSDQYAKAISVAKRTWLVGGRWEGASHAKKPTDMASLAESADCRLDKTVGVYLPSHRQVGFFVFEDDVEPVKNGVPLLDLFLTQVDRRRLTYPLLTMMNLGVCWWMVLVDSSGRALPGWERWGDRQTLSNLIESSEHAGTVNAFRNNRIDFESETEAFAWLFDQMPGKALGRLNRAAPLRTVSRSNNNNLLILGGVAVVAVAGYFGWHAWQNHEKHLAFERALVIQRQQAEALKAQQQQALLAKTAFEQKLITYWKTYPRPWQGAPVTRSAIDRCIADYSAIRTDYAGWYLTSLTCAVAGDAMNVTATYDRGTLATVAHIPPGGSVNTVSYDQVTVPYHQTIRVGPGTGALPEQGDALTALVATTQQSGSLLKFTSSPLFSPFVPPPPSFVPKKQLKQVEQQSPILWYQAPVSITASVSPSYGWSRLIEQPGFVISTLTITTGSAHSGISWSFSGVQYAR